MSNGYANSDSIKNILVKLQSKTATENGTVKADAGFDGLSEVKVNVSNSEGGGSSGEVNPADINLAFNRVLVGGNDGKASEQLPNSSYITPIVITDFSDRPQDGHRPVVIALVHPCYFLFGMVYVEFGNEVTEPDYEYGSIPIIATYDTSIFALYASTNLKVTFPAFSNDTIDIDGVKYRIVGLHFEKSSNDPTWYTSFACIKDEHGGDGELKYKNLGSVTYYSLGGTSVNGLSSKFEPLKLATFINIYGD